MNKSFHPIIATSKYGNNGMKLIPFFSGFTINFSGFTINLPLYQK